MTNCKLSKTQESLSVIMAEVSFVKIVKVNTETVEIPKEYVDKAAKEKAGLTAKRGTGKKAKDIAAEINSGAATIFDGVKPNGGKESMWHSWEHRGDKK